MPNKTRLPGGYEANDAALGSPLGLTVGDQQGSVNMFERQFMNSIMGQINVQNNGGVHIADIDTDSGGSGNDQDNVEEGSIHRSKHYHRHTRYQIQELESFYKICPHPDYEQKEVLGRELGLDPLQIKFWFQNKRTQMKMKHEHHEIAQLQMKKESLLAENMRLKQIIKNVSCVNCGNPNVMGGSSFDEYNLCMENSQLRFELNKMAAIAEKFVGNPMRSVLLPHRIIDNGGEPYSPGQLLTGLYFNKQKVVEVAMVAMKEFLWLAQVVEPLWAPVLIDGNISYSLNEDEYFRAFHGILSPRQHGFRWESTRDSVVVGMNYLNFIETLMNVNKWATLFCGIVAKATHLELLSTGIAGNHDGSLQVIHAEFQMITPFVPTRETCMARLCKQHGDAVWSVVDVSLDELLANPVVKFRKRPSGCLIQKMSNRSTKITWIEHVEVMEDGVTNIYTSMINSGAAFGAKYWLSILHGKFERFASSVATEFPPNNIISVEARRSMLKVAERMVLEFCNRAGLSSGNKWTSLSHSGMDDVKVMSNKIVNNSGVMISFATSLWLPAASNAVFNYLRNENNRSKWDILNHGAEFAKITHITTGENEGNCISLLQVKATSENPNNKFILQESFTYPTGSFVIYSPIDPSSANKVLDGEGTNDVSLLPSGFAILPDDSMGGTVVTIVFQVLIDLTPVAKHSSSDITIVNNLVLGTVDRVKSILTGTFNE